MRNKILYILFLLLALDSIIFAKPIKIPKRITFDLGDCQDLLENLDTCKVSKCTSSMSLDQNKILYKYFIKEYKEEKCILQKMILLRDEEQRPLVFNEICALSNEGRKVLMSEIIAQLNGDYETLFSGNNNPIIRNECKAK